MVTAKMTARIRTASTLLQARDLLISVRSSIAFDHEDVVKVDKTIENIDSLIHAAAAQRAA